MSPRRGAPRIHRVTSSQRSRAHHPLTPSVQGWRGPRPAAPTAPWRARPRPAHKSMYHPGGAIWGVGGARRWIANVSLTCPAPRSRRTYRCPWCVLWVTSPSGGGVGGVGNVWMRRHARKEEEGQHHRARPRSPTREQGSLDAPRIPRGDEGVETDALPIQPVPHKGAHELRARQVAGEVGGEEGLDAHLVGERGRWPGPRRRGVRGKAWASGCAA